MFVFILSNKQFKNTYIKKKALPPNNWSEFGKLEYLALLCL